MELEQKRHILLVEDDPFTRNLLSVQLGERGYWVTTAENGIQAMESIENNPADVVLTDIFMPDMDGLELIRNLRKHYPGILIFALSGGTHFANKGDYLKFATRFGADEVFVKPVELAKLIAKLELHMGNAEQGDLF